MENGILSYKDILNQIIEEKKYLINNIELIDVSEFQDIVVKSYFEKATCYFKNHVIPHLLNSKLSKKSSGKADIVSYNLVNSYITRMGYNISIKEFLTLIGEEKTNFNLINYISDPLKMNLSEKIHQTFFSKLNIKYIKLPNRGKNKVDFSKKIKIGRLTMDYIIGDKCVSTNKMLVGTSGTDYIAKTDFLTVIQSFKANYSSIKYKYLAIIFDFQSKKLKNVTDDWKRSYSYKIKLINELKKEAGDYLNEKIFIGRFKNLFDQGYLEYIAS